ncbi:hypothetical protein CUJ84_Chr003524 [Rhizobium leguminosarum]|uniref:Uncharacterized protein n=1 Tax=Rhizobium leguminosarum TaxID=384 RepID=A0A2K9Z6P8_RHILE|nr:hypothetical protein CUJ84_Chr003524 [Rhizobium leguminosarum]
MDIARIFVLSTFPRFPVEEQDAEKKSRLV